MVLPPGGGKTRVGLEAAVRLGQPVLVLVPNTAIAGQWLAEARRHGWEPGEDRSLTAALTVITYQALAVFDDADEPADADGDGGSAAAEPEPVRQLDRLHDNARALVERLRSLGPVTLVLDECHHLLQVWGALLGEVLGLLPQARVIALTATPPQTLRADEARLVARLFGPIAYAASIPAFVRDGYLAPFRELACLVEPTADEAEYIAGEALRFAELRSDLMSEEFASTGFLAWLDQRFVARTATTATSPAAGAAVASATVGSAAGQITVVPWDRLERADPDLCRAALRACTAGLMAHPDGARIREEHRAPLSAEDWIALLDDYVMGALVPSSDPRDVAAVEAIRAAVPSIGYRLTRTGLARTAAPIDRVVARSAAKALASVGLLDAEWAVRGDRLRALVVCDYERASGPVPARLVGVLEPDEGSARMALRRLATDPATAGLAPVLVSASAVACAAPTAARLLPWLADRGHAVSATTPREADTASIVDLTGRWTSRQWVPLLTAWLEEGQGQVLIGTRGLLGEGWDARRVNVVIDLTSATTPVAVTQVRGRALRTDPADQDKVAHTWSVACIADGHPRGDADYARLVRKHAGFFAVTEEGAITDGIAHVDPALSPYLVPTADERAALGLRMLTAARQMDRTRALWQVGQPYVDRPVREIRVRLPRGLGTGVRTTALERPDRLTVRTGGPTGSRVTWRPRRWTALRSWLSGGDDLLGAGAGDASLQSMGAAVADGLAAAQALPVGANAVRVAPSPDGSYRLWLADVPEEAAALFAESLDEVLAPLTEPRYVIPRYLLPVPGTRKERRRLAWRRLWRRPVPVAVVWHAVPSRMGTRRGATAFATSWHSWVSPGDPLFTGSPEGAGILAAQRGEDPFAVTTAMRTEWQ